MKKAHSDCLTSEDNESTQTSRYTIKGYKLFGCDRCDASFKHVQSLSNHCSKAHGKEVADVEMPYECQLCDRRFSSKQGLKTHEIRKHSGNNWSTVRGAKKSYDCHDCDKKFDSKAKWEEHQNVSCRDADSVLRLFSCGTCSNNYGSERQLKHHQKI